MHGVRVNRELLVDAALRPSDGAWPGTQPADRTVANWLRIDRGPGYRLYLGREGEALVILLGGGVKKSQTGDIAAAQGRWQAYKQEKRNAREGTQGQ